MMKRDRKPLLSKLEALRKRNNKSQLVPEEAVRDALARPDKIWKKELPSYFWDDKRCAHEHRISIMRGVFASIEVQVEVSSNVIIAPYYVHDPKAGNQQGYTTTTSLKSNKRVAMEVVQEEFARAMAAFRRAVGVAEVVGLKQEILRLMDQIQALQDKLAA